MVWYGMVDVCDGYLAAKAPGMVWYGMVWYGMVWLGPASDRDNVTRQTLRAGTRAPPPEKPYVTHRAMGEHGTA